LSARQQPSGDSGLEGEQALAFSSNTKAPIARAKVATNNNRNRLAALNRPPPPIDYSLEGAVKDVLADQERQAAEDSSTIDESLRTETDAPLVRLVNSIIAEAIKRNASDIHIEPFENLLRVRFRVDGHLLEIQKLPFKLAPAITSRLKVMANMDICEKRVPQDGCIRFKINGAAADVRISTLPSVFGEKVVMRVLGTTNLNNDLSKIGIPDDQLALLRNAISKPNGLVLVTGPTGSGKTTTLYAALNEVNDISVSVFTAEDPVEGTLMGVTQSQVNAAVGFTFASILRSFLRQDPDVILVGEIRDQETAEICIKASLTGHLVLSTLHTNCAVSTIGRLIDIGIAPYLLTTSINCIVAQRLARRVCSECKETRPVPEEILENLGSAGEILRGASLTYGKGCPNCHGTGYKGRAPVYEILEMNEEVRRLILKGVSKEEIKQAARRNGMLTLREAGLRLVRDGLTTLEEILGISSEDEAPTIAQTSLLVNESAGAAQTQQILQPAPVQPLVARPETLIIAPELTPRLPSPEPAPSSNSLQTVESSVIGAAPMPQAVEPDHAVATPNTASDIHSATIELPKVPNSGAITLPNSTNNSGVSSQKTGGRWKSGKTSSEARLN
jgi:type IV pilus assembly protein PilB